MTWELYTLAWLLNITVQADLGKAEPYGPPIFWINTFLLIVRACLDQMSKFLFCLTHFHFSILISWCSFRCSLFWWKPEICSTTTFTQPLVTKPQSTFTVFDILSHRRSSVFSAFAAVIKPDRPPSHPKHHFSPNSPNIFPNLISSNWGPCNKDIKWKAGISWKLIFPTSGDMSFSTLPERMHFFFFRDLFTRFGVFLFIILWVGILLHVYQMLRSA